MNNENCRPLLYIQSVQSVNLKQGQEVYDSRFNKTSELKKETIVNQLEKTSSEDSISLSNDEIILLNKMILLNNKDIVVFGKFYYLDNKNSNDLEITGAPIAINDNILNINVNGQITSLKLSNIKTFLIC